MVLTGLSLYNIHLVNCVCASVCLRAHARSHILPHRGNRAGSFRFLTVTSALASISYPTVLQPCAGELSCPCLSSGALGGNKQALAPALRALGQQV